MQRREDSWPAGGEGRHEGGEAPKALGRQNLYERRMAWGEQCDWVAPAGAQLVMKGQESGTCLKSWVDS